MMEAKEFRGYVYANNDEEVRELERALWTFVEEQRREGRAVTAAKLTAAIGRWREHPLVRYKVIEYFKQ